MSMASIRRAYGVPARRGMRVRVDGAEGVITSASPSSMHLRVRLDGHRHPVPFHPTWRVVYLDAQGVAIPYPGQGAHRRRKAAKGEAGA